MVCPHVLERGANFGPFAQVNPRYGDGGRVDGDTTVPALLSAAGLADLEQAVYDAATPEAGRQRPCFCGAESTDYWRAAGAQTWGCEEHMRPLLEFVGAEATP